MPFAIITTLFPFAVSLLGLTVVVPLVVGYPKYAQGKEDDKNP